MLVDSRNKLAKGRRILGALHVEHEWMSLEDRPSEVKAQYLCLNALGDTHLRSQSSVIHGVTYFHDEITQKT